jgi:hypothetical protein
VLCSHLPEVHRLQADRAVPHPLEPGLRRGAVGGGALPAAAGIGPEPSGAGECTARLGVGELAAEDRPGGGPESCGGRCHCQGGVFVGGGKKLARARNRRIDWILGIGRNLSRRNRSCRMTHSRAVTTGN